MVRSAQVHALMPMMQFSVAPWRILSESNQKICEEMAQYMCRWGEILGWAKEASKSGEPIVKPMAMAFPDAGYELIKDQFVLGDEIIVAPVVEKGARSFGRFASGTLKAEDGTLYRGEKTIH